MNQDLFESCLPWVICVIVGAIGLRFLISVSGAELRLKRVRTIHSSQDGSVQSLSFVLTLPFFVMTVMMIVQASHIMIGNIVVHYSAFAAVRSASVWIPANTSSIETSNRIGEVTQIEATEEGERYLIAPIGQKFTKIHQAATLACMPLGPSRDLGYSLNGDQQATHSALRNLHRGLDPEAENSGLISTRLHNKLAYSYSNTSVRLTFWHRNTLINEHFRDPPLQTQYFVPQDWEEYQLNELGWQDELTAQVTYNLPLLPGPIRLFAPRNELSNGASRIDESGNAYLWPISGTATMGLEGEKPLIHFWQEEF